MKPARKRSPASAKLWSPWSPAEAKRQGQGELFSDDLGELPERSAERENRRLWRAAGLSKDEFVSKVRAGPASPIPSERPCLRLHPHRRPSRPEGSQICIGQHVEV